MIGKNSKILNKTRPKKLSLGWNPEIATQLVVTCDDARFPYINIWDLRNAGSPVQSFSGGHTKGILDISWSPHSPSLILSTALDNKLLCWNISTVFHIYTIQNHQFFIGRDNF